MGTSIEKYGLDRLHRKALELSFKCPYCSSVRLHMRHREDLDYWQGVVCPKCQSRIILDSLTLVALREGAPPGPQPAGEGDKVSA